MKKIVNHQKKSKKLILSTDTVHVLTNLELARAGGGTDSGYNTCTAPTK